MVKGDLAPMALAVVIDLFSGAPNPRWQIPCARADAFVQAFAGLVPAPGAAIAAPGLGYRGFVVAMDCPGLPEAALRVFGDLVERDGRVYRDPDRRLERFLIESAAPIVPAETLRAFGLSR